jgi:hypothetical protein
LRHYSSPHGRTPERLACLGIIYDISHQSYPDVLPAYMYLSRAAARYLYARLIYAEPLRRDGPRALGHNGHTYYVGLIRRDDGASSLALDVLYERHVALGTRREDLDARPGQDASRADQGWTGGVGAGID